MKIIILSACLYLLYPLNAISASANSDLGKPVVKMSKNPLVGKWKFVDAKCADNRALTEEDKVAIQYLASLEPVREFNTDGILIDSGEGVEIMGSSCSYKSTMPYLISSNSNDMAKAISQTTEMPANLQVMSRIEGGEYPIMEFSCKNRNAIKRIVTEVLVRVGHKLSATFYDQGFLPFFTWDEDQGGFKKFVLFYTAPPWNGTGNFRCDEGVYLISMFEEI